MNKSATITVKGIVQGVGFRPFINKLAISNNLTGNVSNKTGSVLIRVSGNKDNIETFVKSITAKKPAPAFISDVAVKYDAKQKKFAKFSIIKSKASNEIKLIPPDLKLCDKCLSELDNKANRRHNYPFINCTDCGPRFTIIKNTPYDRANTTMKPFKMCPDCNSEYTDINNRRYHAEPNACEVCGPQVYLTNNEGKELKHGNDAMAQTRTYLKAGKIVAIKGIGGYHIACDATNDKAVLELQKRKKRSKKPFAVMSENITTIKKYALINKHEEKLLKSTQAPIVLLSRKKSSIISEHVASGLEQIGVFLPYAPLHHLLFKDGIKSLVMTSANIAEEPIQHKNNYVIKSLEGIVDYFLMHNRDINIPADDSVIKPSKSADVLIRRSRGYVPVPVFLDKKFQDVVGVGALLKNTTCFIKGDMAFMSQHVGDLENTKAYTYFEKTIEDFSRFYEVQPRAVVCDKHPDYLSTRYAKDCTKKRGIKLVQLQHHYSHMLSVMAENNHYSKAIGVIFDGTGLGDDGHIWGSEFLVGDFKSFERLGHFAYNKIPGGDKGSSEAYRNAISLLYNSGNSDFLMKKFKQYNPKLIIQMMEKNINSPLSSGMGRIFDAAAAITGACELSTYDAEAPMRFEAEAMRYKGVPSVYPYILNEQDGITIPDISSMVSEMVKDLSNKSIPYISATFHNTIANITLDTVKVISKQVNLTDVCLSGGVWQNTVLLEMVVKLLKRSGFNVLLHKNVSPNDSGIALGQAVYGGMNI